MGLEISTPTAFFAGASKNLGASVLATTGPGVQVLLQENHSTSETLDSASTVLQWLLTLRKYMLMHSGEHITNLHELEEWYRLHEASCYKDFATYWMTGQTEETDRFRQWPPEKKAIAIDLLDKLNKKMITDEEFNKDYPKINDHGQTKMMFQIAMFLLRSTFAGKEMGRVRHTTERDREQQSAAPFFD